MSRPAQNHYVMIPVVEGAKEHLDFLREIQQQVSRERYQEERMRVACERFLQHYADKHHMGLEITYFSSVAHSHEWERISE